MPYRAPFLRLEWLLRTGEAGAGPLWGRRERSALQPSGFPTTTMPAWTQDLTFALPVRCYTKATGGVFPKASGPASCATRAAALAVPGVVRLRGGGRPLVPRAGSLIQRQAFDRNAGVTRRLPNCTTHMCSHLPSRW